MATLIVDFLASLEGREVLVRDPAWDILQRHLTNLRTSVGGDNSSSQV